VWHLTVTKSFKMKKKSYILFLLATALTLPTLASAQGIFQGMVIRIVDIVLYVGYAIVVVFWIITGMLFLTAMGAPEKLSSAKRAFFMALAGTVIVVLAKSAQTIVENALGI